MTHFLQLSTAGTVAVDLEARPSATPTFVVRQPGGGVLQAATNATLDGVNTTLAGAAAAGSTTVSVASATGITVGRKYLLTGPEDTGGERVTVRSVASTTVTLVRPLRLAHAASAAFQSTRVACAVDAIATVARHYRVEVTYAVGGVTQPARVLALDCVRYVPQSSITSFDDVADFDPVLGKRLPLGTWFPALRDESWQMLLELVAARVPPGAVVSSAALSAAHRYHLRALLAETAGEAWEPYRERMAKRFAETLDAALGAAPVDTDQDGAVEKHEAWYRGVEITRG